MTELGDLLRKLRGDLSLRDAAKKAEVSHNYLRVVEKGVDPRSGSPVSPSPETLKSLSKAYNYPYEELMKMAGYLPDVEDFIDNANSGEGVREQSASRIKDSGMAFYGGGEDWTEEERLAAEAYIEVLRAKKKEQKEEQKKK